MRAAAVWLVVALGALPVVRAQAPPAQSQFRELIGRLNSTAGRPFPNLSADLNAAVASGGTYAGVTLMGRPVLLPNTDATIPTMADRLARFAATLDTPSTTVTPLTEVVVTGTTPAPDRLDVSGAAIIRRSAFSNGVVIQASDGLTSSILTAIAKLPWAGHIEPNYPYQLFETSRASAPPQQWGIQRVGADQIWSAVPEAKPLIALLDSGVDPTAHPDLQASLDSHSADLVNNGAPNVDPFGHGTLLAGIISGSGDGGQGTHGVAAKAHILSLRIFDDHGKFASEDRVAEAIDTAIKWHARVINASWGGKTLGDVAKAAVKRALDAGILIVAAAGNLGDDNDADAVYPASIPSDHLIAVLATGKDDHLALFTTGLLSNYGRTSVHIGAPGVDIRSTVRGGGYSPATEGSSAAAAFVAAGCALVWTVSPNLTAAEVAQAVLSHARRVSALSGKSTTGGILDLSFLVGPQPASPPPPSRAGSLSAPPLPPTSAAGTQRNQGPAELVRRTGVIRYGVVAIGGETTGIVLAFGQETLDLQPANDAIRAELKELNGKQVTVEGQLTIRQGVELPNRQVLLVSRVVR